MTPRTVRASQCLAPQERARGFGVFMSGDDEEVTVEMRFFHSLTHCLLPLLFLFSYLVLSFSTLPGFLRFLLRNQPTLLSGLHKKKKKKILVSVIMFSQERKNVLFLLRTKDRFVALYPSPLLKALSPFFPTGSN